MTQAPSIPAGRPVETAPPSVARTATRDVTWPAVAALTWREIARFFRQRNRVIGAVATPLVFWLMLGLGLNEAYVVETGGGYVDIPVEDAVQAQARQERIDSTGVEELPPRRAIEPAKGMGYLEFFFPGIVVLMVLFTAIFSTISVIEDRKEGFLQGVLASPAARWAIVLGKVLGGASIATVQGLVLLLIWCVFFAWPGVGHLVAATVVMFILAMGLTGLGLMIAWPMDSTAGFHAVMNLLLMPMWFLCGAVFPLATAGVIKWLMYANPLTYGNAAFARALMGERAVGVGLPWWLTLGIAVSATAAAVAGATAIASRGGRR